MFLVFFNTPPKHILFYTKKINMRTKTTRQYRVKSSISKYILSNNSSYALHVERDNSIIYQYTKKYTKIYQQIYQYKLYSNWWQGKRAHKTNICPVQNTKFTYHSQFFFFFFVSFFTRNN